jgi:uncharacterized membrane-anchored protein
VDVLWLVLAGVIVGALGRLQSRSAGPLLWPATIAVAVAAMLVVGLLLPGRFWTYALATVIAAGLVTAVVRVWPEGERAEGERA